MEVNRKILIYNSDFGGHYAEYINHLIRFVNNSDLEAVFYLHEKLQGSLVSYEGVRWIEKKVHRSSHYFRPYFKGLAELDILISIINDEKISHVLLMNIDVFIPVLGRRKYKQLGVKTRGIFFTPHFFKNKNDSFLKESLKFLIQYFNFLKLDKGVEKIFVLNNKPVSNSLNKLKAVRNVFHYLQEPLDSEVKLSNEFSIYKDLKVVKREFTFLIFGCINVRKNIENILDAFVHLDSATKLMCNLLIIGEPMEGYGNHIKPVIEHMIQQEKELNIYCSFSFLKEAFKDTLFHEIDFVLLPYLNFYSSSGVLGWAAKHDKLVLVPRHGLMSDLVAEFNMGLSVNAKSIDSISQGILELIKNKKEMEEKADFEGYKKECSIEDFRDTLFSGL